MNDFLLENLEQFPFPTFDSLETSWKNNKSKK